MFDNNNKALLGSTVVLIMTLFSSAIFAATWDIDIPPNRCQPAPGDACGPVKTCDWGVKVESGEPLNIVEQGAWAQTVQAPDPDQHCAEGEYISTVTCQGGGHWSDTGGGSYTCDEPTLKKR